MGGSILGVKVVGPNGLTQNDSNSHIGGGSQICPKDFTNSQKFRSFNQSSLGNHGKRGNRPCHVVDDFSSFDAQMQNILMDDGSGYGYD